jgi:cytochrome c nitrite reductase small subunit
MRHAYVFTLRKEPQVIFIKDEGREAVQQNCIRCHENLLIDNKMINMIFGYHEHRTDRNCQDCHRYTPHGRVNSISSTPYARVPVPGSPVPGWMKKFIETSTDNK